MYLESINTLRAVNWSRSYLWDIVFLGSTSRNTSPDWRYGPDAPFDTWFPATEVEELRANLQVFDFHPPVRSMSIPKGSDVQRLSISFVDDVNSTLERWMEDWVNGQILNRGAGISPVEECLRSCIVYRIDPMHEPLYGWRYHVYPTGELPWQGRSESATNDYKIDFIIWDKEKVLDVFESYANLRGRNMTLTSDL